AALPPGTYGVRAVAEDRAASSMETVQLPAGGLTAVQLRVGGASSIDVVAGDERGPLPVKIVAQPTGAGRAAFPSSLGEKAAYQSVIAFAAGGRATLPVFPGPWKVSVSRGFEYDLAVVNVDAPPGGAAQVAAQLHRVVDTTGWVSG